MSEFTKDDYDAIVERIKAAGTSVDEAYNTASNAASTLCDVNQTMEYNPNITVVRNGNGDVIGYDYKYTSPSPSNDAAISVDSNNDHGSFGTATGGGGYSAGGGAGRSSNYAGTINTDQTSTDKATGVDGVVAGYISPEWGIVSALSKFGKTITDATSDAILNTAESMADLLEIIGTRSGKALRVLFGVDENGNTTMYMDGDTLGALAIATKDDGYYNDVSKSTIETTPVDFPSGVSINGKITRYYFTPFPINVIYGRVPRTYNVYCLCGYGDYGYIGADIYVGEKNENVALLPAHACFRRDGSDYRIVIASSDSSIVNTTLAGIAILNGELKYTTTSGPNKGNYTYNNKTVYYNSIKTSYINNGLLYDYSEQTAFNNNSIGPVAWYMVYGENWHSESGGIPGTSTQSGATVPVDAITGADPHVVAENLVNQYPDLMGTPIQIVVMDDSCNEKTINYYSVPISYSPTNVGVDVPITGTLQLDPSFNPNIELPDVNIDNYIDQIIEQLSGSGAGRDITTVDPTTGEVETLPNEPPATGSGTTPPAVMPEAQVTAMWHVYHPTSSALSALGSWLWSSSIIDQVVRLFTNPMEAIIGVHAIYTPPVISSAVPIVVGNLTSNVDAPAVSRQYVSLDCGTVEVFEYFGNVFDYDPFTKISLYLPFIGIVPLRVADVMRGFVHIVYNIDVYTGACIAMVDVSRDGVGGVIYQFTGNCAVEYPVSGANYSRMLQAAMSAGVASLASGMATGGNPFMGAIAAGTAFTQGKMDFQRSGSFSGNPGAMGPKKPYLIITRPQTNMADQYQLYDGRGSNFTTKLKQCSGYTRCKEVHLNVPGAYHDELLEIERLLKEGVLFPGGAEM